MPVGTCFQLVRFLSASVLFASQAASSASTSHQSRRCPTPLRALKLCPCLSCTRVGPRKPVHSVFEVICGSLSGTVAASSSFVSLPELQPSTAFHQPTAGIPFYEKARIRMSRQEDPALRGRPREQNRTPQILSGTATQASCLGQAPGSASKDFGPVTCAVLAADDSTVRKGPRPHPPV